MDIVKIDLKGQKFGKLMVIEKAGKSKHGHLMYKCMCDCGNIKNVRSASLRNGNTQSCGCFNKDSHIIHGMSKTPTFSTWRGMINRCRNQNYPNYSLYGGRGIMVCERWLKFVNFFKDMGEKPEGLTIDRKNNDLGYFKDNCRWTTRAEQSRNQRPSKRNKTGVRGFYWNKKLNKYHVQIMVNYKHIHVGFYRTIKEATAFRKKAEQEYWGQIY